ncbi:MAG: hypothetical protein M3Z01_03640 [Thermoproteota archaeon]|nr:hypothetical protein [Thermoproteota archaeon]
MYSHDNKINKDISPRPHFNEFIIAYDELIDNRRKLFNIPSIDNFFYFQDKKNISIINRCKTTHFLYHLITILCIEYAKNNKKSKTILIDGGRNNLGYLYLDLIKLSSKEHQQQFNVNQLLDNIIISRAFTFYQLANIIIKELPKLIQKLNCKIQIIVLDVFDALFSLTSNKVKSKSIINVMDIEEEDKIKLLDEILQNIINFSKYHFSILAFTDFKKTFNKNIFSHFNQILEINSIYNNKSNKNESILHMKTMSTEKSLMLDSILEIV